MKLKRPKKYSLYEIKFFDHFVGGADEIICINVGYYIKESENYYIFSHWIVDSQDELLQENNMELCAILKSAIVAMVEIDSLLLH